MTTGLVKNDIYLKPYAAYIEQRCAALAEFKCKLLGAQVSLSDFANGHLYFGCHYNAADKTVVLREWAPNATSLYLIGSFNNWEALPEFLFESLTNGCWQLTVSESVLPHGTLYALQIRWGNGAGRRVPAWCTYAVQDPKTYMFSAQVWRPAEVFNWQFESPQVPQCGLLIYEAHIGMSGETPEVHSYSYFTSNILPYIKRQGYNAVQLMAVQEHPYYGSFGYHVSSFFAPSSRYGTPDDLKLLVDTAHGLGLLVIMDLVHSHAVKNEAEGLGNYAGDRTQFFHAGLRGEHSGWDSYCFNYGSVEVVHFLLSNLKYWLTEFRFDGFRFDGVTSMLYLNHGLNQSFTSYDDYFNANLDIEAQTYLGLATDLVHQVKANAICIAEEMSGLPGLAAPIADGGLGFNYRMAMGVPDFWIKLIKDYDDSAWNVNEIFYELTAKRSDEKTVTYAESHDQALVGDQTLIFRLLQTAMYNSMQLNQTSPVIARGLSLHKIVKLLTITCAGGAYLNFMGNEFGHPEWIDFPREGNNWSYQHARRLWSLSQNQNLYYHKLLAFDRALTLFIEQSCLYAHTHIVKTFANETMQVLAYRRGAYLVVVNLNSTESFSDCVIYVDEVGKYMPILNTDDVAFSGEGRISPQTYYTQPSMHNKAIKIYLPARTAVILKYEAPKGL